MIRFPAALLALSLGLVACVHAAEPAAPGPVLFNTAFEGASLGLIEKMGETEFRLHVKGQQDSRGRNRQATWFFFRVDDVAGRELTLRLTSFKGEYNDKPANSPAGAWFRPVISEDGVSWRNVASAAWDEKRDELTLTVRSSGNSLWIAHIPPYPVGRLQDLLRDLSRLPHVRTEVIGRSVQGRDLPLVTITNRARPDAGKRVVWLQARQHAWETGTSFVMEGAMTFIASDDPAARALRDETIFLFTPMLNPDSVASGEVRFNANGFDPNRHWDEVDLKDVRWLERLPEIWHAKQAILAQHARQPIDVMLNLHNTEMNEYVDTMVDAEPHQARFHRLFARLMTTTTFDPSRPKLTLFAGSGPANTTNSLWREARVPIMLMEQRIGPSQKAGRIMTTEDRLEFGRQLIALLAEAAR
ncbi:M14-type cytosolic carboxypeptidase [Horticoccus sp. 23ND18S-11]|uniref:M14-type cytosolic carboxypeptidase n=1 Tax=Horticoccus sp. 23ND18S-11 TaxID=3391832 RepID=UPI0039C9D033